MNKRVFLCGIGGSGMSSLALILKSEGFDVWGSDRSYDDGEAPEKFDLLKKAGIDIVPQDGRGLDASCQSLIVSSAIEETIPDVKAARALSIPIQKRADVLAEHFNGRRGIAVGGTSGKSTVTAMLGHILHETGCDPTVVNGANMVNAMDEGVAGLGNARIGKSGLVVIEADESDGTIVLYEPEIAVLTNISLDHKPVSEITPLFEGFVKKARAGAVVNLDNQGSASLAGVHPHTMTFSTKNPAAALLATDISLHADGTAFSVLEKSTGEKVKAHLKVPGNHNVENALAALGAARLSGVSLKDAAQALSTFKGVKRRLEILGTADGVTVIDDFGHNPDKIAATIATLRQTSGRLLIMFQPHGFTPMRIMGKDIAKTFAKGMDENDLLLMPEILYKGGTVVRDVSSADITNAVNAGGKAALFFEKRQDILDYIVEEAKPGDRIVIMGARDDTLTDFAGDILKKIGQREKTRLPKAPDITP